jgi:hypothetical protein
MHINSIAKSQGNFAMELMAKKVDHLRYAISAQADDRL